MTDFGELANVKLKVLRGRLGKNLGKQGFHYGTKEVFETTTKTVEESI